jgi:hypothetical protein
MALRKSKTQGRRELSHIQNPKVNAPVNAAQRLKYIRGAVENFIQWIKFILVSARELKSLLDKPKKDSTDDKNIKIKTREIEQGIQAINDIMPAFARLPDTAIIVRLWDDMSSMLKNNPNNLLYPETMGQKLIRELEEVPKHPMLAQTQPQTTLRKELIQKRREAVPIMTERFAALVNLFDKLIAAGKDEDIWKYANNIVENHVNYLKTIPEILRYFTDSGGLFVADKLDGFLELCQPRMVWTLEKVKTAQKIIVLLEPLLPDLKLDPPLKSDKESRKDNSR